jgi:hypothetical protein
MKKQKPKRLELNKITVTNLSQLGTNEAHAVKGGSDAICSFISHCVTACNTCKALSCTCMSNCPTCEDNTCGVCGTVCSDCWTQRLC